MFSARAAVTLCFFMHLLTILLILGLFDYIPIKPTDGKGQKRVVIFLIMLPIYLILAVVVRKKHILELKMRHKNDTPKMVKAANLKLLAYIAASFVILMVLAVIIRG